MSGGQVLLFRAGGLRLGVFLAEVARLLVEDRVTAVPFSHAAMAGLLVVDDDLAATVPVFDLGGLTGAPVTTDKARLQRTVALFPTSKGPVGLRLEELLGTIARYDALDTDATSHLHEGVDVALLRTVTGAARAPDGSAFSFFSPDAFLAGLGL